MERIRWLATDCKIGLVVEKGVPNGLPADADVELLRLVREALTNAQYHSGAKSVVVTLKVEGSDLVAEISDDGRGFDLGAVSGVGLRRRAAGMHLPVIPASFRAPG